MCSVCFFQPRHVLRLGRNSGIVCLSSRLDPATEFMRCSGSARSAALRGQTPRGRARLPCEVIAQRSISGCHSASASVAVQSRNAAAANVLLRAKELACLFWSWRLANYSFFRHSIVSAASGFCCYPTRLCSRRLRKTVVVDAPLRALVGLPCSQLICLHS